MNGFVIHPSSEVDLLRILLHAPDLSLYRFVLACLRKDTSFGQGLTVNLHGTNTVDLTLKTQMAGIQ